MIGPNRFAYSASTASASAAIWRDDSGGTSIPCANKSTTIVTSPAFSFYESVL